MDFIVCVIIRDMKHRFGFLEVMAAISVFYAVSMPPFAERPYDFRRKLMEDLYGLPLE